MTGRCGICGKTSDEIVGYGDCGNHRPIAETTEGIARRTIGQHVTLNGYPATISRGVGCAVIRSLEGRMVGQWSWVAVARIVDNHGGDFRL